jgi:hypothetical protein
LPDANDFFGVDFTDFRERIWREAGFAEQKVLRKILKRKPAPGVPANRTFRFFKSFLLSAEGDKRNLSVYPG